MYVAVSKGLWCPRSTCSPYITGKVKITDKNGSEWLPSKKNDK